MTALTVVDARRRLHRAGVGAAGGTLVLVGLVLVPLPGPGWLVVAAGTGLLGREFPWAAGPSRRLQDGLAGCVRTADRYRGGRALLALLVVASTVLPLVAL